MATTSAPAPKPTGGDSGAAGGGFGIGVQVGTALGQLVQAIYGAASKPAPAAPAAPGASPAPNRKPPQAGMEIALLNAILKPPAA